jgi:hypothetical protein
MSQTASYRFKRRLRTYSGRSCSTITGGVNTPVFFMHLPKCGGTSVSEALYATVPIQKRVAVIDANSTRRTTAILQNDIDDLLTQHDDLPNSANVYALREQMLINHMAWGSQLIHGHVLFSARADKHFGNTYKYVTVLRDPISRVLSNYSHSVVGGLISDDFAAYLGGDVVRAHCLTFLRYFSGTANLSPQQETAALETAKVNIAKFSVVGFLDDLDKFKSDYQRALGARPRIPTYNTASKPAFEPTKQQMDTLKDLMRNELQFWDYARAMYFDRA